MEKAKIVEWVDIGAPRARVFDLVLDVERRMQLSPMWGVTAVAGKSADYPAEGSRYRVKFLKVDQPGYETVVTTLLPGRKFAYQLQISRGTEVSWTVQDTPRGTRLVYQEEFITSGEEGDEFTRSVREVIRKWLADIKRYAELKENRLDRLIKWFLDRYFLKLEPDQRKVILMILFMQLVGMISFIMAAIAFGLVGLVG